jgi:adenylate kinase family enzyme
MRIFIVGNHGTGKSALGKRMSADLNIAVTDLDRLYWSNGFVRNEDRFERQLYSVMKSTDMILEGWVGLHAVLPLLKWADYVVYLKFPYQASFQTIMKKDIFQKSYPDQVNISERTKVLIQHLYKESVERIHFQSEPVLRNWLETFKKEGLMIVSSTDQLNECYSSMIEFFKQNRK